MSRNLQTIIKTVVTLGVTLFIVNRLGWQTIVDTFVRADLKWVFATAIVFAVSNVLGAYQWRLLLVNKGIHLSIPRAIEIYFIGMFFSNFLFGMAAADAVRVGYLTRDTKKGTQGIAATFLDRFAGLLAMLGFAMVGSLLLIKQKALENRSLDIALISLAVTFALFVAVLCLLVSSRLQKTFFSVFEKVPLPFKAQIHRLISKVVFETEDRHIVLPVAALSFVIQFLRIGGSIFCAAALGLLHTWNIHYFFIFVPMLAMLMIIPLPFGVREGIGGALYALAGFKVNAAFVMNFLTSIVGIVVSIPGAIVFVAKKREQIGRSSS